MRKVSNLVTKGYKEGNMKSTARIGNIKKLGNDVQEVTIELLIDNTKMLNSFNVLVEPHVPVFIGDKIIIDDVNRTLVKDGIAYRMFQGLFKWY